MRAIEIFETKFKKPRIMYHGTSDVFLPSILKQGLLPNPKKKKWDTDDQEVESSFSRVSLSGSYWTSNYMTASSSATNNRQKFGGNELTIIAQIAEQSAYADEDNINSPLKWAMSDTVIEFNPNIRPDFWISIADGVFGEDAILRDKIEISFMNNLHKHLDGSEKHIPNRKLSNDILETLLLRAMVFEKKNGMRLEHWIRNIPPLPSIKEIEQHLLHLRDKITRSYRNTTNYSPDIYNHTLRVNVPVGFSGANKILWIIRKRKYEWIDNGKGINGGSQLIVHPLEMLYGTLPLPADFLKQYKERIGQFPGLVDKTGKILMPNERKNS